MGYVKRKSHKIILGPLIEFIFVTFRKLLVILGRPTFTFCDYGLVRKMALLMLAKFKWKTEKSVYQEILVALYLSVL